MHDTENNERTENMNKQEAPPLRAAKDTTAAHRSAPRIHETHYTTQATAQRALYAIIDLVTDSIIGGVQLHLNNASAIRTLTDLATADTNIRKHPNDFELRRLGWLDIDHTVIPDHTSTVVCTGEQINAIVEAYELQRQEKANRAR